MKRNIIVTTQGANLQIYFDLIKRIKINGKLGFITSFYRNFKDFKEKEKELRFHSFYKRMGDI